MITLTKYSVAWHPETLQREFPNIGAILTFGYDTEKEALEYWEKLDEWNKSHMSVFRVTAQVGITSFNVEKV